MLLNGDICLQNTEQKYSLAIINKNKCQNKNKQKKREI